MKLLPDLSIKTIRAIVAEFLATFIFVFSVCAVGINVARLESKASVTASGITTGLTAFAVIRTFGDWSGAHFNPAVTVGAVVGGKIHPLIGLLYIFQQLIGAIAAVGVVGAVFPGDNIASLLVLHPDPSVKIYNAVLMEFVLTFILVFVIYGTVMGLDTKPHRRRPVDLESNAEEQTAAQTNEYALSLKQNAAPAAIGATLGLLCFLGGSSSGGAFNPARVTAPALLAWDLEGLWIYWMGDLAGAAVAALLHTHFFMNLA